MRRILLISALCLLAVASTGCKKAQLRRQLKELMGSTIVLPEKISCVYNGEVYPMPDSLRHRPKFIVFVDSTDCTTCVISHFYQFAPLFDLPNVYPFETQFLLQTKKGEREGIIRHLTFCDFQHPVFLDDAYLFSRINPQIPADDRFHCLLLDEEDRVLFVGNPISSERSLSVFTQTLSILSQS